MSQFAQDFDEAAWDNLASMFGESVTYTLADGSERDITGLVTKENWDEINSQSSNIRDRTCSLTVTMRSDAEGVLEDELENWSGQKFAVSCGVFHVIGVKMNNGTAIIRGRAVEENLRRQSGTISRLTGGR